MNSSPETIYENKILEMMTNHSGISLYDLVLVLNRHIKPFDLAIFDKAANNLVGKNQIQVVSARSQSRVNIHFYSYLTTIQINAPISYQDIHR